MKINLDKIKPSPRPIRTSWDEDKLNELAQSIKEQGLIVPIKIRPVGPRAESWRGGSDVAGVDFEIVYGHRRVEAMRRICLDDTDAIVEGVDDFSALLQQITENEARENVPVLEKAIGFERALNHPEAKQNNWQVKDLAKSVGVSPKTIYNFLKWLREYQQGTAVSRETSGPTGQSEGYETTLEIARALKDDTEAKQGVARKVSEEGLGRNQARQVADSVAATKDPRRREMLLETPYSTFIHDPEMNRARAQEYGAYDPTSISKEPTQGQRWEASPEVKAIIDLLRSWVKKTDEIESAIIEGKFAPEAKRFTLPTVEQLIFNLKSIKRELESDDD